MENDVDTKEMTNDGLEKFREYAEYAKIAVDEGESMEAGDAHRLALYSADAIQALNEQAEELRLLRAVYSCVNGDPCCELCGIIIHGDGLRTHEPDCPCAAIEKLAWHSI